MVEMLLPIQYLHYILLVGVVLVLEVEIVQQLHLVMAETDLLMFMHMALQIR